jgi:AcrR family transcriptional regulator
MGRQKTISDEDVLGVARALFRERGHTATTREIAQAAGISEAVLYQRFGSKDELFHAAMAPRTPDLEQLLGPKDPPEDAHVYLRTVVVRIGTYFAEVLPLVVRVMTHPSFDPAMLRQGRSPRPAAVLQEGLAERLASLARRRRIVVPSTAVAARLLVSLAHDWGLGTLFSSDPPARRERELQAMVDVVWEGLRAPEA